MNSDLIDRAQLPTVRIEIPKRLDDETLEIVEGLVKAFKAVIDSAPAVDAEPVRHGRWEPVMLQDVFGRQFVYRHACSGCHEYALHECANYDAEEDLSDYCPFCGAKMDAEVNDVD